MSRLIFVPQFPGVGLRYQEWWINELPNKFSRHFDEVITLGQWRYTEISYDRELFSPTDQAIQFELVQIQEYLNLELRKDDILFHTDLSYPGIFHDVLYHKRPSKCFVFCHATAKNKYDYFSKVRSSKFQSESGHAKLYNTIFVGSKYHKNKLGWKNIKVVGLPEPPIVYKLIDTPKIYDIVSVARPCVQKINKKIEKQVEKRYGKIIRPVVPFKTWEQYSEFLNSSKILLITTKEDTFNYTVLDAILTDCVPIAPNTLCFPEILPRRYLYSNVGELYSIINKVLNGKLETPKIKCQNLVDSFYDNICNLMKG